MIARLPGENKTNMGEHLEIVCLFQAAEIERLIDNLEDYKLRLFIIYLGLRKSRKKNLTGTAIKFRSNS
jgi:hypothetical protein